MDYITLLIGLLIGIVVGYFGNQLIQKNKKEQKEDNEQNDVFSEIKALKDEVKDYNTNAKTERGSLNQILMDMRAAEQQVGHAALEIKRTLVTGGGQKQGACALAQDPAAYGRVQSSCRQDCKNKSGSSSACGLGECAQNKPVPHDHARLPSAHFRGKQERRHRQGHAELHRDPRRIDSARLDPDCRRHPRRRRRDLLDLPRGASVPRSNEGPPEQPRGSRPSRLLRPRSV